MLDHLHLVLQLHRRLLILHFLKQVHLFLHYYLEEDLLEVCFHFLLLLINLHRLIPHLLQQNHLVQLDQHFRPVHHQACAR